MLSPDFQWIHKLLVVIWYAHCTLILQEKQKPD